jgi:hypothetical protein
MRPECLTSLWPFIVSEMIQVFRALEFELINDDDKVK